MAIQPRNQDTDIISALVVANNKLVLDGIGTHFHGSKRQLTIRPDTRNYSVVLDTIATADSTIEDEAILLINEIQEYTDTHFTAVTPTHDTGTASAVVTIADSTDTATAITLANEIKENLMVHFTAANVHYTNDDTNTITTADATDAATLVTLVNEIKEQVVDHATDGPNGHTIIVVPA